MSKKADVFHLLDLVENKALAVVEANADLPLLPVKQIACHLQIALHQSL